MAITRAYKPLLDALGLTYPQYLVLNVLGEAPEGKGGGITIGGIAERLDLESSTVTPLVKRLEAAGLVARRRGTRGRAPGRGDNDRSRTRAPGPLGMPERRPARAVGHGRRGSGRAQQANPGAARSDRAGVRGAAGPPRPSGLKAARAGTRPTRP
ncbi:MarR family transcriptional regulator [Caulobacter sp. UC70_42]|uniref:MarR family transcriptional regulator n=1 Tax=Caulobacter sp. UC70_42 TaxID=3374551 RepID=UPI0037572099